MILYLIPNNVLILIGIFFITTETLLISPIYTTPVDVYGKDNFENDIWEFSLIGSTGDIIAPSSLWPLGILLGFNEAFLILLIFPIY